MLTSSSTSRVSVNLEQIIYISVTDLQNFTCFRLTRSVRSVEVLGIRCFRSNLIMRLMRTTPRVFPIVDTEWGRVVSAIISFILIAVVLSVSSRISTMSVRVSITSVLMITAVSGRIVIPMARIVARIVSFSIAVASRVSMITGALRIPLATWSKNIGQVISHQMYRNVSFDPRAAALR
jgi:hypothetical protein